MLFRQLGRTPARPPAAPVRSVSTWLQVAAPVDDARRQHGSDARPRSRAPDAVPMGDRPRAARTKPSSPTGRSHDAADSLGEPLRDFANGLVRGTDRRLPRSTRSSPRTRRTGASSGWPCSTASCCGSPSTSCCRAGHAGACRHQRGARAGAHLFRRRGGAVRQRRAGRGAERAETGIGQCSGLTFPAESLRCRRACSQQSHPHDRRRPRSDQLRQRRANFEELVRLGVDPYPRDVRADPHSRRARGGTRRRDRGGSSRRDRSRPRRRAASSRSAASARRTSS